MPPITSTTMKELRPAFKENGYCTSEKPWCAKKPKAIDLDTYNATKDTLLADWMVRFLPLKRQEVVRFCKAIDSILHYEQCKATPINGTCDGVKKTTLYSVHKQCDRKVLKKHKQAEKDRKWLWAKLGAAVAAIVTALVWILRPFWNNPGDGKDDDSSDPGWRKWRPAYEQAKANFKAARGFRAKMRALVTGIGQVYNAWRVPVPPAPATTEAPAHPTDAPVSGTQTDPGVPDSARQTDQNVQRATVIVEETWPQTHDALREADYSITHFLHNLDETAYPNMRDDLDQANLSPLTQILPEADIDDLREHLYGNADALDAFRDTVTVVQQHVLPFVTGKVAHEQRAAAREEGLARLEMVDMTWEEIYRYLRAVDDLQTATGMLRSIVGTIGSVYSVDPELNDAWRDVIDRARGLLHDVDDIVSSYMSAFEHGHVREPEKTLWIDIEDDVFDIHEIATAEGVIKTVERLLRGRAQENDVDFNVPDHFSHIPIPERQRFALLLIAYSRAKDSIDFRCPDREDENPFVNMWVNTDGDFATLHIVDNGRGMPNLEEAKRRGTSLRYAFKLADQYGMTMNCQPRWIPNEYYGRGEDSKVSAGTEFQIRFRMDPSNPTPPYEPSPSWTGNGGDVPPGSVGPQHMSPSLAMTVGSNCFMHP